MSDNFDQVPYVDTMFADEVFASNPEPRCACLLLIDTSSSMNGSPINELNEGLIAFKDELSADALATKRVEIAIVKFGPVQVMTQFQSVDEFHPPRLVANGNTPMGEAIEIGLNLLNERKEIYRRNGISTYRPWVFLITDGGPTDSWARASQMVHDGEANKKFMFFAVGVQDANMNVLKQISARDPLKLSGLRFRDLFKWLSNSLSAVSKSSPGELVPMVNPTGPNGWGMIG